LINGKQIGCCSNVLQRRNTYFPTRENSRTLKASVKNRDKRSNECSA